MEVFGDAQRMQGFVPKNPLTGSTPRAWAPSQSDELNMKEPAELPKPLVDDIASGKCLPFVGAGFSSNAKLPEGETMPDWPALTDIMATAGRFVGEDVGPDVASLYERQFGRVQLIETIREALQSDTAEPGQAHIAFAQLPFDTIYTTNFDLLLEQAYGRIQKPYRSLVGELQMPFHGGPLSANVVKMHGDLGHEEHIIVTREDYEQFLENYPVVSTHLSAMLITRTALFIGYSLSDPDFSHIREVIRSRLGRFQRMCYIIQFNRSDAEVERMLDEDLHVLNIRTRKGTLTDAVLAEFFARIQQELDALESWKFRSRKPEMFEDVSQDAVEAASRASDAPALLSSSSNLCFVLMPFGEPFDDLYRSLIHPVIMQAGLNPLRADEIYGPGLIMEQIRSAIRQSRVCIADLSGLNPNVLYELGIAQTLGKPTILLSQDLSEVPFDVAQFRVITYTTDPADLGRAQAALAKALQQVLGYDLLDEARKMIRGGMTRAAVATLGVLLENSLRQLLDGRDLVDAQLRGRMQRLPSMGRMVQMLVEAAAITPEEASGLREAIEVRNRAVHEPKEPTKQSAEALLHHVESFIGKHMPDARQSPQGGT